MTIAEFNDPMMYWWRQTRRERSSVTYIEKPMLLLVGDVGDRLSHFFPQVGFAHAG